jgi:hypothetical protein
MSPCWFNVREDASDGTVGINTYAWTYNSTARAQPATFGPPRAAATTSSVSGSTSSSATASASSSSSPETTTSLSTGAIAGIGAGAGLVGLAGLGAIVFLCLRRRGRARRGADAVMEAKMAGSDSSQSQRPYYDAAAAGGTQGDERKAGLVYDVTPRAPQELYAGMEHMPLVPQELSAERR